MAEEIIYDPSPYLSELESKIGRKTPESLLTWMKDAAACEDSMRSDDSHNLSSSCSLSDKISELKQEMMRLRSADVRILRELVALHEGIETMRWLMEERSSVGSQMEDEDDEHGVLMSPCRESPSSPFLPSLSETFSETVMEQNHQPLNCDDSSHSESHEAGPSSLSSSSSDVSRPAHECQLEAPVSAADSPVSDDLAASLKRMPDPARLRNIKSGAETIKKALLRCGKLRRQLKVETSLTPVLGKRNGELQSEESFASSQNDLAAKAERSTNGVKSSLRYNTQWYSIESKDDVTNL
ncbi:leucine rich adaptor protein 1-like [Kryptolebias marmoratus]|uniref:Leucine rich adaptor protein 1-like n=1 Tax=Kryptolebias marmoratus TaxID=37003 RepID=A0A3Q3A031_KRYMA|nr:leucine rich adaptor protein 1-like [Kryptolebias marmoratus]